MRDEVIKKGEDNFHRPFYLNNGMLAILWYLRSSLPIFETVKQNNIRITGNDEIIIRITGNFLGSAGRNKRLNFRLGPTCSFKPFKDIKTLIELHISFCISGRFLQSQSRMWLDLQKGSYTYNDKYYYSET